jgi:hypothetical protein
MVSFDSSAAPTEAIGERMSPSESAVERTWFAIFIGLFLLILVAANLLKLLPFQICALWAANRLFYNSLVQKRQLFSLQPRIYLANPSTTNNQFDQSTGLNNISLS